MRDAAEPLTRDASAPELAGVHVVGQTYDRDPVATVALPADVLMASIALAKP